MYGKSTYEGREVTLRECHRNTKECQKRTDKYNQNQYSPDTSKYRYFP